MAVGLVDTRDEWLSTRGGVTAPSTPGGRGGFITDVIIELGLASEAAVETALEEARIMCRQPGAILVERGDLTANDLARAIAERHGLHHVDLEEFEVDDDATRLIDRNAARRYCALPIAFTPNGTLVVAIADPLDGIAVSDIAVITKSELLPVVADADALRARIERLPEAQRRVAPTVAAPVAAAVAAAPPAAAVAPGQAVAPMPSVDPPTSGPEASSSVLEGAVEELSRDAESLRGELDREREARAEAEHERDEERERAAQTIKAVADAADGELQTLRAELERERGEAAAKIADDVAGENDRDELRGEIEKLRGELADERAARAAIERERDEAAEARQSLEAGDAETEALRAEVDELRDRLDRERAVSAERERRRETERAQHAHTARALEQAGSEKEELRVELEREHAGRIDLERRLDAERVQHAQTTKALDEAGAEMESLRVKRDRDREAHDAALRLLDERREDLARAGDEIRRALESLDEVTGATTSAADEPEN